MTDSLLPCPSCARHVRSTEDACPFCAASITRGAVRPVPRVGARLSRAALYALGASAAALAACGGNSTSSSDAGANGDAQIGPMYGGPPVEAGSDQFVPTPTPAYGGPPQDAGTEPGDGGANDGGKEGGGVKDGGPAPAYGAPPAQ